MFRAKTNSKTVFAVRSILFVASDRSWLMIGKGYGSGIKNAHSTPNSPLTHDHYKNLSKKKKKKKEKEKKIHT